MSEEIANTKKCAVVGVVVQHIQVEIDCALDRTMATMADEPHLPRITAHQNSGDVSRSVING